MYLLDSERGRLGASNWAEGSTTCLPNVRGRFDAGDFELGGRRDRPLRGPRRRPGRPRRRDARVSCDRERRWGQANTATCRSLGGLLALYGLTRRGTLASLFRTVGTGLLVGSAGRGGLGGSVIPSADRRRAVDIQKTLHIDAPVEQVYAFWSNYENFPLFMSHVREVEDLGAGRSRWSVSGPGGVPIEWNAVLTQQGPNEVIAWRSEAGSMLENAGIIRFAASGSGTRVDLRFCYHPPAGGAGQAVAELLGSDPRAKLNEDLGRMKALLEATTRSETHGKESQP